MQPANAQAVLDEAAKPKDLYVVEEPGDAKAAGRLLTTLMPLLRDCWQPYQEQVGITFNPDWQEMLALLSDGRMVIITARHGPKIVGFQMWTIHGYYYSMGTRVAMMHRILAGKKRGINTKEFLKFGARMMRERGAKTAMFASQPGSAAEILYQSLGCKPLDMIWGIDLWPGQSPVQ